VVGAMTVRDLYERLGAFVGDGFGDAVVFAAMDDPEIDAAMQESGTEWTPAELDLTAAEVTGRAAPMLIITHVAFSYA
jgi:hypothetical protein